MCPKIKQSRSECVTPTLCYTFLGGSSSVPNSEGFNNIFIKIKRLKIFL